MAEAEYLQVEWHHSSPDDPVLILAELDEAKWEVRKLEIFSDGRMGFSDESEEVGGTFRSSEAWPSLGEIAIQGEFSPRLITKQEFEAQWALRHQRTTPVLKGRD